MNLKNQSFQNSLRCLQHPATWVSIALLLINDHVLKVLSPSFLTGKLSDFAGLFFFPFIVAACLSLILSNFKMTSQGIGLIAFGFVATWFILLKTLQPVNFLTAQLILLIGIPSHYALDPTDIIALSAMLPAWLIWKQPSILKSTKPAYIALIIGSLAAIATSAREPTVYKVTNLEYYKDEIVYAADTDGWGENSYPIAKSLDGGTTWQLDPETRNIEEKGLPIKHCSHINWEICYRVTKNGQLQELVNSGTWANVQQLENVHVYDLILAEWDDKEYVIVAAGGYGIWRCTLPDGQWSKISILRANQ